MNTNIVRTKSVRALTMLALLAGLCLIPGDVPAAGRFGGGGGGGGGARPAGGGGFSGGGARPGGGGGGAPARSAPVSAPRPAQQPARTGSASTSTVHGPYGGAAASGKQSAAVTTPGGASATASRAGAASTGPRGGAAAAGARGGSVTGPGGATAAGGAKGGVYTGPRGTTVVGGAAAGGVEGPRGNTVAGGKSGAAVIGPNGNVHASGKEAVGVKTPGGAAVAGREGTVNVGPGGVTASGARGAAAVGVGGAAVAGGRGAVAVGPHGAVAAGGAYAGRVGPGGAAVAGTRYVGAANLRGQGAVVRAGYRHYGAFRPGWYNRYPGAWAAAGWVAGRAYRPLAWGTGTSWLGYPATVAPVYYNYGDTVTYQGGDVYYGDNVAATEADYANQATAIADTGIQAQPPAEEMWEPLGVFAMIKGDETESNDIFQLAINKDGIVRGNYYNAVTDSTKPVAGALDKKSQRIAWTIDGKKDVVFETGLYNLTQEQTTMLVHFGPDRTEQYKLFRVPEEEGAEQPK